MKQFLKKTAAVGTVLTAAATLAAETTEKPNIIVIYIDDMGYSDLGCYGGKYTPTPNMDRLAAEGVRFTQYYSSCPISSPSRVGITTGMYPTRWGITTYLQTRAGNAQNEQNDYLDDRAPSMARTMKENGYATGHFGKWHMGGGRDVNDAPAITNYGFDKYHSTWESPDADPKLTSSNWIWDAKDEVKRWDRTAYFVDKTLEFLEDNPDKPCFINLWPDDVHTPWVYEEDGNQGRESEVNFTKVLAELDVQIGRLMDGLETLGIDDNTLVIFTSDNGPAPSFSGKRTDELRGQKATLYEGGIRMPFIVRWPDKIAPGQVDNNSVICSVDLLPSLCAITGAEAPTDFPLDGEDMSAALLGTEQTRTNPLFWEFGKNVANRTSPHIAVREGDWKLLVNADGSKVELYNMATDYLEKTNVASANASVVNRLKPMAIEWFEKSFREFADNIIYVSTDGDALESGISWDKATTLNNAITLTAQYPNAKIWLKAGTYTVTSSINFDGMSIYGGFEGTENQLNERNWKLNPTIIDGGNAVSPLRATAGGCTLDGVIVQNGVNHADASGNGNGGAVLVADGSVIRNCIFRNNRTQNGKNGAAVHCHLGNVTIENCLFTNNTSSGNGGAIQVGGATSATVINCTFTNNKSTKPGGAFGVGAANSNLTLINTIAYNNLHGEIYSSYGQNDNINGGGAVISKNSAIESTSTKFTDGDDIMHTALTREKAPGFAAPATIIGKSTVEAEITQIENASYELLETSLCIDAGDASLTNSLKYDLGMQRRLSGIQIDMGAYEFDNGLPPERLTIYAAPNGSAEKDGSSWENATTLIRAVSLSASLNEPQVWLKAGTYTVTSSINFDGVAIYGGFEGTEEQADERNWHINSTIIDGGNAVSPLRAIAGNSILDGIILQNGVNQAGASGNGNGGGVIVGDGSMIKNCIFRNNRTQNGTNGAAIHCHSGNVTIENSLFVNNTSSGNGGAVQVGGGTSATVINCTFANNKSTKPGGAFGLGNETSNLTLINTVAYNNLHGENYNSYGQNDNVNGGGTVISKNSAIESTSTKFTDGNDINHTALTREKAPGFVAPATVIGKTTVESEFEQIKAASYQLAQSSLCIDAGTPAEAAHISLDLAGKGRIQGSSIDIGAYEYQAGAASVPTHPSHNIVAYVIENKLYISGIEKGKQLQLFDVKGSLVYSQKISENKESITVSLAQRGVYLIKTDDDIIKVVY